MVLYRFMNVGPFSTYDVEQCDEEWCEARIGRETPHGGLRR